MKPTPARRLVWGLLGVSGALYLFTVAAATQVTPVYPPLALRVHLWAIVLLTVVFGTFSVVGALIGSHSPRNGIGWLFLGIGLAVGLSLALVSYVETSLPARDWAEWASDWTGVTVFSQITLVLLLFPDGKLVSRRWRPVVWLTLFVGLSQIAGAFTPHAPPEYSFVNPMGVDAVRGTLFQDGNIGWILLPVAMAAAAGSFVVRFRASAGHLRQQLKWFALANSLVVIGFLMQNVLWLSTWLELGGSVETTLRAAAVLIPVGCFIAVPIASGIAILRYRLYDIDIIINRALVYGALTAVLALVYVLGSVGIGTLFRSLSGQQENDIVVAASTLAVAALFRPARARIQARVDKRFYRSRYDAQRTVEAFSTRLQDELDLDSLARELVSVVKTTMQPTHVSVWLRHGAASEGG